MTNMTVAAQSVIAELDTALSKASRTKQASMLWSIVDLYLAGVKKTYSKELAVIFDQVISRLIEILDNASLAELSAKLAAIDHAPETVIERLASNDDIAVAGPVLGTSTTLMGASLAAIAKTKSASHLSVIAARSDLAETVTDVLLDRGGADIARKVAGNHGARFSELGFVKLIKRAENDRELAALIAARADLPRELRPFLKLVPE